MYGGVGNLFPGKRTVKKRGILKFDGELYQDDRLSDLPNLCMDLNEMANDRFSSRQVGLRRDVVAAIQERFSRMNGDIFYFNNKDRFRAEKSSAEDEFVVGLKKVDGSIVVIFLKGGVERSQGLDWEHFTVVDLVTIERIVCAF